MTGPGFGDLLELWPEPTVLLDVHARLLAANRAARERLGALVEADPALLRVRVGDTPLPADPATRAAALRALTGETAETPVVVSLDGVDHPFRVRARPLRSDNGEVTALCVRLGAPGAAVPVDATAADIAALLPTLARGAAHEINNPLTFITGCVDLLSDELPALARAAPEDTAAEIRRALDELRDGARRIARLAAALRARGAPVGPPNVEPLKFGTVVEDALLLCGAEIRRHARMAPARIQATPVVAADEPRLFHAIATLLLAAVSTAGRERGEVRVAAYTDADGSACLEVTHATLAGPVPLEPVAVLHAVRDEPDAPGLLRVRELVQAMGGEVAVEVVPPRGRRYLLHLPGAAAA